MIAGYLGRLPIGVERGELTSEGVGFVGLKFFDDAIDRGPKKESDGGVSKDKNRHLLKSLVPKSWPRKLC